MPVELEKIWRENQKATPVAFQQIPSDYVHLHRELCSWRCAWALLIHAELFEIRLQATVASYLVDHAETLTTATLARRIVAIGRAHIMRGFPPDQ